MRFIAALAPTGTLAAHRVVLSESGAQAHAVQTLVRLPVRNSGTAGLFPRHHVKRELRDENRRLRDRADSGIEQPARMSEAELDEALGVGTLEAGRVIAGEFGVWERRHGVAPSTPGQ